MLGYAYRYLLSDVVATAKPERCKCHQEQLYMDVLIAVHTKARQRGALHKKTIPNIESFV